jgi:hypothetical protein
LTRRVSSRCFKGYDGLNEMHKVEWNNRSEEILRAAATFHLILHTPLHAKLLTVHASLAAFQGILYVPRTGCGGGLLLPAGHVWPHQRGRSSCHRDRQEVMAIRCYVWGKFAPEWRTAHNRYMLRDVPNWFMRNVRSMMLNPLCFDLCFFSSFRRFLLATS